MDIYKQQIIEIGLVYGLDLSKSLNQVNSKKSMIFILDNLKPLRDPRSILNKRKDNSSYKDIILSALRGGRKRTIIIENTPELMIRIEDPAPPIKYTKMKDILLTIAQEYKIPLKDIDIQSEYEIQNMWDAFEPLINPEGYIENIIRAQIN